MIHSKVVTVTNHYVASNSIQMYKWLKQNLQKGKNLDSQANSKRIPGKDFIEQRGNQKDVKTSQRAG